MDTHATCFLISAMVRRSGHGRLSSSGSLAMLAAMRGTGTAGSAL